MKRKHILLSLLLSMILIASTGCQQELAVNKTVFQGTIEANNVDINSKIAGRLASLVIEEGQYIEEQAVVSTIDARDLQAKRDGLVAVSKAAQAGIEAAKAQAEAAEGQLAAAQATLNKAQNGARVEEVAKAQANYDIMKKSYDRVKTLFDNEAVPQATLDEMETKLNVASQDLKMANEGARSEDIEAAKGQVAAYQGQVAAAKMNIAASEEKYAQALAGIAEVDTYITDASIKSPLAGYVTSLNASSGEMVSTGMNIATITDLTDTWIALDVDETELSKFKENQEVVITTLSYKDQEFKGTIVQINKKADFAVKKASNENGDFDLVSYAVKVKIENPDELFRPGMTAFVKVGL
ncbi:HlyD family secretion protein [Fusibacter sp. 3D3]|uniref:HlyD family secretion protein n=1 Tax=Fusibacter sp. 3D3 TaxID=1048380 RepID=UPI0008538CC3|nr:efflux RND transporter periplasmic adaptor subunit [Fusibacter sp. 3D3]GAU79252.1 HlyD family secretion protein [Fusibacter sp. 3D3]